jgi:hypothetical protein
MVTQGYCAIDETSPVIPPARPKKSGNLCYAVSILSVLVAPHLPFEITNSPRARKGKKRRVVQTETHQSKQILQEILSFIQGRAKIKSTEKK